MFHWLNASQQGLRPRTDRYRGTRFRPRVESLEERSCPSSLAPPQVTMNPADVTADSGQMVTLTAAATGMPMPMVQWEVSTDGGKHFVLITGATRDTLSFVARPFENGYEYEAVFMNAAGHATTRAATLTVDFAPIITHQPRNRLVAAGSQVTLTAAARADPAATVQWQISTDGGKTFQDIAGATSTTLQFTAPATAGIEEFRAVFTNAVGTTVTRAAAVKVDIPPTVTLNPTSQTVHVGQRVTFTAAATGTPSPLVQWQVSRDGGKTWMNIMGATSRTLSFMAPVRANGYEYRAVFFNPVGHVITTAASLMVG